MLITLIVDKRLLDDLVRISGHKSKVAAVKVAMSEYLRHKKVEKIKAMKGRLKFDKSADELRHN
ncbi:MAG TPA: type II toxin-antitoxin system VapB family antitoxin [Cyclobacteriaceae bacterium]